MKPTVLVTGAGGFLGAWVLRELFRRKLDTVAVDLGRGDERWHRLVGGAADRLAFIEGDIRDQTVMTRVLQEHCVTHVIHLAGLLTPACQQDPGRGGEVNVLGSLRLFELLRNRPEPIQGLAYASSYAVHGPGGGISRSPETFYGAFKRSVELIAEQYSRHFGLHSVGLRPFVVYGAGREQGISAAPSLAARAAALGKPYALSFSGSAGLVYVEDVAAAFVRCALETPLGSHFIDMPGEEVTMEQVVEVLERLRRGMRGKLSIAGPPLPATREERPLLMNSLFPDWQATPLDEGLRRTVEGWAWLES